MPLVHRVVPLLPTGVTKIVLHIPDQVAHALIHNRTQAIPLAVLPHHLDPTIALHHALVTADQTEAATVAEASVAAVVEVVASAAVVAAVAEEASVAAVAVAVVADKALFLT